MTHIEAFMNAEAEAQAEYDRENDPVGYALRTGEIDHLSPADLRKYDELRADANEDTAMQAVQDREHLTETTEELANVKAVLGRLLDQVYQMQGMFPGDEALQEAIDEAEEVLG